MHYYNIVKYYYRQYQILGYFYNLDEAMSYVTDQCVQRKVNSRTIPTSNGPERVIIMDSCPKIIIASNEIMNGIIVDIKKFNHYYVSHDILDKFTIPSWFQYKANEDHPLDISGYPLLNERINFLENPIPPSKKNVNSRRFFLCFSNSNDYGRYTDIIIPYKERFCSPSPLKMKTI